MTAYDAFQNPTDWSFQKWKKWSVMKKMQNHVTITKRQNAENLYDVIHHYSFQPEKESHQEPQAESKQ